MVPKPRDSETAQFSLVSVGPRRSEKREQTFPPIHFYEAFILLFYELFDSAKINISLI